MIFFFLFRAEDSIRDTSVTGVQTCALPISIRRSTTLRTRRCVLCSLGVLVTITVSEPVQQLTGHDRRTVDPAGVTLVEIGRASCRERGTIAGLGGIV